MSENTTTNIDERTVRGFGDEWTRFDQSQLPDEERLKLFGQYFDVFPWDALPAGATGFDLGCGSGRWAKLVAPRVGKLICIDASVDALQVAKRTLEGEKNCELVHASVDALPLADDSMDFGYSLGVLHHVPDTKAGIAACVKKLKRGAPFLVYLYYALDNRPLWFRSVWRATDVARRAISAMPYPARSAVSQMIAATVYFPIARACSIAEAAGVDVHGVPLSHYRNRSFYSMRTDALDRFGTRLEQRFTKTQVGEMLKAAGLVNIKFREGEPYWCASGIRA